PAIASREKAALLYVRISERSLTCENARGGSVAKASSRPCPNTQSSHHQVAEVARLIQPPKKARMPDWKSWQKKYWLSPFGIGEAYHLDLSAARCGQKRQP